MHISVLQPRMQTANCLGYPDRNRPMDCRSGSRKPRRSAQRTSGHDWLSGLGPHPKLKRFFIQSYCFAMTASVLDVISQSGKFRERPHVGSRFGNNGWGDILVCTCREASGGGCCFLEILEGRLFWEESLPEGGGGDQ